MGCSSSVQLSTDDILRQPEARFQEVAEPSLSCSSTCKSPGSSAMAPARKAPRLLDSHDSMLSPSASACSSNLPSGILSPSACSCTVPASPGAAPASPGPAGQGAAGAQGPDSPTQWKHPHKPPHLRPDDQPSTSAGASGGGSRIAPSCAGTAAVPQQLPLPARRVPHPVGGFFDSPGPAHPGSAAGLVLPGAAQQQQQQGGMAAATPAVPAGRALWGRGVLGEDPSVSTGQQQPRQATGAQPALPPIPVGSHGRSGGGSRLVLLPSPRGGGAAAPLPPPPSQSGTACPAAPLHPLLKAVAAAAASPRLTAPAVAAALVPSRPSTAASAAGAGGGGGGGGARRGGRRGGARAGLVTLQCVVHFLQTRVLSRGPGAARLTTRQVVEAVIAPACAAAGGCRYPDAPDPAALCVPRTPSPTPTAPREAAAAAASPTPAAATPVSADDDAPPPPPGCRSGRSSCGGAASSSGTATTPTSSACPSAPASPPAAAPGAALAPALPPPVPGSPAPPLAPYLYVVHAWDCCFVDLVAALAAHLEGVPAEEAVIWLDVFALEQHSPHSPLPGHAATAEPQQQSQLQQQLQLSAAAADGGAAAAGSWRVEAARAAIREAGAVLVCLLPPGTAGGRASGSNTSFSSSAAGSTSVRFGRPSCDEGAAPPPPPLPPALRRTWCLWELATALRLRGPDAVVLLAPPPPADAPRPAGAAAVQSPPQPMPYGAAAGHASCVSGAAAVSLSLHRSGATCVADRAALMADMRPPTGGPAAAAAAAPTPAAASAASTPAEVDATEAALRLFVALQPTGYDSELGEHRLRTAPEAAAAARGAPALPGSGPGGYSGGAVAGGGGGGGSCWRLEPLWELLGDAASPRCVVITSPQGGGKSTLTAALWSPPQRPPAPGPDPQGHVVHAVHLCHHADAGRQEPLSVVRSLSYQLALRFPVFRTAVLASLAGGRRASGSIDPAAAAGGAAAAAAAAAAADPAAAAASALEEAVEALLARPVRAMEAAAAAAGAAAPAVVLLIDGVDERGPAAVLAAAAPTAGAAASAAPHQVPLPPSGAKPPSPRPANPPSCAPAAAAPPAAAPAAPAAPAPAPVAAASAFPLAPLVAVLLRRLPRSVRLLLTAATSPAAHGAATAATPAAAASPSPAATATAADLAAWLCGRASAPPSPRPSAAAATPVAALLPVSALRDDSHLAASLHRQLVLRAGPDAAPQLLAAMLARGRDNLSYYVACLRLHALRAEALPACAAAAHEAVFAQELRALGAAERAAAHALLALLAAAQEPVPMRLLARAGLAGSLALLPGWGSLFGAGRDGRVLVMSASVAGWLRSPAAAAAGLCTAPQLAAAHGLLAAALCEEVYGGGAAAAAGCDMVQGNISRLDGGQDPAGGPRSTAAPAAPCRYSRRHLPAHLEAALAAAAGAGAVRGADGSSTAPAPLACGACKAQGVGLELSRLSLSAPETPPRSGGGEASDGGGAAAAGGVGELPRAGPSLAQLKAWAALVAADPRFAVGGERAAPPRPAAGQEQRRGAACLRPAAQTA